MILFSVFSDRICRRRQNAAGKAVMVGGRGVRLSLESVVKESEFFFALDGVESLQNSETTIHLESGIEKGLLLSLLGNEIETCESLTFEREKGQFYLRQSKVFRGLTIEEGGVSIAKAKDVEEHLPQVLVSEWDWILKENKNLFSWVNRFGFLIRRRELLNDSTLRDSLALYNSEELFTMEQKNKAFTMASQGEQDFFSVARKNLVLYFEYLLQQDVARALTEQVPARVQVPSGTFIEIQYPPARDPYIEVRIQEVFGWTETPKLLDGHQPLTLSLLGPNYRPMQITSNLESFWRTAYAEVRRELRLRYPKHSWPEDPLTAKAVAKGKSTKK